MASTSSKLVVCIFIASCFIFTTAKSRPLSISNSTLAARLKLDEEEGSSACWDSLFKLQSCSGELILFFLNGEAYLGPSCCRAIRIVGHDCWPSMLGSLGFTSEESDILRGYCDASDSSNVTSPPHTATANISNTLVPSMG
ncbi:Egg cell-secreted protein 1.1 [Heracleum sosnowskyi]|uniref:Egg cell-secreted protein 1.1 n=1 Tax=Heracleum sosnowskyi TaxID=360622 RepID=A0AAD8I2V8_9APIA|nr:Egg cell-secreted protein 1.1 [Heracleum sosnowskyi]